MPDVYIRNKNFERIDLIEGVVELIWTIRYQAPGDVVLRVPISRFSYTSLVEGHYVELPSSTRLMIIESVLRDRDNENLINVKGRGLESILENRILMPETASAEEWIMTGNVGYVATTAVRRICVEGTGLTANDVIPNFEVLNQDASTISKTVKLKPTDLLKVVTDLCVEDGLGFRLTFDKENKSTSFRIYRGTDHSRSQSINPRVIFSNELENLSQGSLLRSIDDYKNVAYVKSGSLVRRVQIGSGTYSGFNRRVMYVDASDIENPTNALLDSRGRTELANHRKKILMDGEVQETRTYRYGTDYVLGDMVTLQGEDGGFRDARITEYITTYGSDGVRSYPTFTSLET